ncbi:hypothetical protein G205_02318 [Arthrobacter nitrophenolicus]|uniref:Uncharacterized protein n=1 Tax=Arthrobacter nitrophenolicus TaxID=683150 RepID=L8TR73_9MICC|nr:hypothetical protein G205_02318 [Arthrobacter nitrophenolicus]
MAEATTDDSPPQDGSGAAEHHRGLRDFSVRGAQQDQSQHQGEDQAQRVESGESQAHELPGTAAEAVAEQGQFQP